MSDDSDPELDLEADAADDELDSAFGHLYRGKYRILPIDADPTDAQEEARDRQAQQGRFVRVKDEQTPIRFKTAGVFLDQVNGDTEWVVDGWVPRGVLSVATGRPGTGKSYFHLEMAIRAAVGQPVMNKPADAPIRVLFVSSEDSAVQTGVRMKRIISKVGLSTTERDRLNENFVIAMTDGVSMTLLEEVEEVPVRSVPFRRVSSDLRPTETFDLLDHDVKTRRIDWVILDPLADLHEGNENDRAFVTRFMGWLSRWALSCNIACTLIAHPAKATEGDGAIYSGSTAWFGKARSWWTMTADETGIVTVTHHKNQYGPKQDDILLQFSGADIQILDEEQGQAARAFHEAEVDNRVFQLIDRWARSGNHLTDQPSARDGVYARAKNSGFDYNSVEEAIMRLLAAGRIKRVPLDGRDGRRKKKGIEGFEPAQRGAL